MNSPRIRKASFVVIGLIILMGWICWLVRVDPVPKERASVVLGELIEAAKETTTEKNYFTRKLVLVRSYRLCNRLAAHQEFESIADSARQDFEKTLFSRKEWLGF